MRLTPIASISITMKSVTMVRRSSEDLLRLLTDILDSARLALMQAQETLRQYAEQLAAQNAELDAFAHTVAHDLKGPVSLVIGYAELLSDDSLSLPSTDRQEFAEQILHAGRKLDSIIESLLLLAGVRTAQLQTRDVRYHRQAAQLAPMGAISREKDLIVEYDDSELLAAIESDKLNLDTVDESIKSQKLMMQKLESILQREPAFRHLGEAAAAQNTTSAGEAPVGG